MGKSWHNILPKNHSQEVLRIAYVAFAIELCKNYLEKRIDSEELCDSIEDLLLHNPDKNDSYMKDVDDALENLSLNPDYYVKEEYKSLIALQKKIRSGVRLAQAPGILCYYVLQENDETVKSIAVAVFYDGSALRVRDTNHEIYHTYKQLFDGKNISLESANKIIPKTIGNFTLTHTTSATIEASV